MQRRELVPLQGVFMSRARKIQKNDQSLKFQQLEATRKRHDLICFALTGGIISLAFNLPNLFETITPELAAKNTLILLGPVLAIWHGGHENLHKKEINEFGNVKFETPYIGKFSGSIMWIPLFLLAIFV
jgi:hypothetical protein